jgi:hypothetical protein
MKKFMVLYITPAAAIEQMIRVPKKSRKRKWNRGLLGLRKAEKHSLIWEHRWETECISLRKALPKGKQK